MTKYTGYYQSKNGYVVKKRKNVPKGFNTPKQICIRCETVAIHKNDKQYDSKICKDCKE